MNNPSRSSLFLLPSRVVFFLIAAWMQTGCSLFFGNIKPLDEKSTTYETLDLQADFPNWKLVHTFENEDEKEEKKIDPGSQADTAYQSKKTASIISINSACALEAADETHDLSALTNRLLLGITDISRHEQKSLVIAGSPALQTIIRGKIDGEEMTLETVVLEKDHCTYDLMYIARPDHFSEEQPVFSKFITSLRIK